MPIETNFDIPLIAAMALREKQIQQNYRPIIAVHKWFARRPGTLFRGLILAEFGDRPLSESFFEANDFSGRTVADPFMGGGTPLLEANRVGCDVLGFDINPMATWIVKEEIEHLDLAAYRSAADGLLQSLKRELCGRYVTDCPLYGDRDVPVKYFLWVKVLDCEQCGKEFDLFPGYIVADDTRHPKNVVVCAACGELNEVKNLERLGNCASCRAALLVSGPAKRGRCSCPACGHANSYPRRESGPPRHRMFAIEYYNPKRKDGHRGRFFKRPDAKDARQAEAASKQWQDTVSRFVPDQEILPGDESDRLHRWGYRRYRDLFNDRQLLGLETSCRLIAAQPDERVRRALATNLSDLLRYQNLLCRYDSMALKSLDIFSVHGFPVGLVQCESNLLGIANGNGANVGSGGWSNIIDKYAKAKEYCGAPFEVMQQSRRKITVPIRGEWIGERLNGSRTRTVSIRCVSSTTVTLPDNSLDAVFTDPPYFGNVQYAELMDFCYVWLRKLVGEDWEGFSRITTRAADELTGNQTEARGLEEFTDGLGAVYRAMAAALKENSPLAFTFHHNNREAYEAVGVAILDSRLACTMTLPCPAEMSGSIHIHGTGSSIVDTVFVCRRGTPQILPQQFDTLPELAELIRTELGQLRAAGMKPSQGDIRCIIYGHLTRKAIQALRESWNPELPAAERLRIFKAEMDRFGDHRRILSSLIEDMKVAFRPVPATALLFEGLPDAVSF
jgi:adenine-specific DNA methylase